jgi:hypothetical protein
MKVEGTKKCRLQGHEGGSGQKFASLLILSPFDVVSSRFPQIPTFIKTQALNSSTATTQIHYPSLVHPMIAVLST